MNQPNLVPIGQPFPTRGIWSSLLIAVGLIAGCLLVGLFSGNFNVSLISLMFLAIPAIGIPVMIKQNTYAVLDTANWLIHLNGGPPRPISHLTYCTTRFFKGVSTLTIGFSDERSERVAVSSNTPFGNPRSDRDWVRYILPYTGLWRDPQSRYGPPVGTSDATLAQAQEFAREWLC